MERVRLCQGRGESVVCCDVMLSGCHVRNGAVVW